VDTLPRHDVELHRRPPVVAAALRTWLRYAVPLTALSAIALSPVVVLALRARTPLDQAGASAVRSLGWELIAIGWLGQLVLVGGASAITRARPAQLSQLGAFVRGFVQLARAIVPCLAAAAAIAIGGLALVAPGLVLLVLLALTGASRARGVPASLADSIAAARRQLPAVALAVAAMIAIDLAIGAIAQRTFLVPLPRPPAPAQLAQLRQFVRVIAIALVVASPLPATVLATIRARTEP
jgi:hypothetical protein